MAGDKGGGRVPKGERANLHTLSIEVTPEGDTEHKLQKMRRRQVGIDLGGGEEGGETRNRKPQRQGRTHPRTLQKANMSTAAGIWETGPDLSQN